MSGSHPRNDHLHKMIEIPHEHTGISFFNLSLFWFIVTYTKGTEAAAW